MTFFDEGNVGGDNQDCEKGTSTTELGPVPVPFRLFSERLKPRSATRAPAPDSRFKPHQNFPTLFPEFPPTLSYQQIQY
jgi:hypothetical protein